MSSRYFSGACARSKKCSTPFGIRDVFTTRSRSSAAAARCAQRLSASEMSSRGHQARDRQGIPVLNAFRHQRCLHYCRINANGTRWVCSTPFGIRDVFTQNSVRVERQILVLNAFRHQRCLHALGPVAIVSRSMCSTPFGIRDVFTRMRSTKRATYSSAQRLSASEMSSPTNTGNRSAATKCSTPFGIRDVFTRCWPGTSPRRLRAQRLSASEMSSPRAVRCPRRAR